MQTKKQDKNQLVNTICTFVTLCALLFCEGFFASYSLAEDHRVTVALDPRTSGPTIHRNIYGQFAEHLGRGIYEGIWVGENSSIPNIRGFRKDVLRALKAIKVPVLRWPGGCFADEYHWRDGVGPRNKRPVKVNTHWGGVEESNQFGTHEFFEFAELLGAETYLNGNLGSGSVQEMAEWIEYLTSDTASGLANLRREHGRDKPFKVDYFGIGNEPWGCGGNMRPEYYADLYNHYATFLKSPGNNTPLYIASGSQGEDTSWTAVLSQNVRRKMSGISHHYYTLPTGKWHKKGASRGFTESEWMSTMVNTLKMDEFIQANKKVLDENDPEGKLALYIDEWGTWYDAEGGREPGFLYQKNTLRDALVAAANFNIFHHHADRVRMTNIAQMVNVLQAMILTDKERMVLTPTYHVFSMYAVFQDATSISTQITQPAMYQLGAQSIPTLSASAALTADKRLYLALVNFDPNRGVTVSLETKGKKLTKATGQLLSALEMDGHNSFDQPENLRPTQYDASVNRASVNKGQMALHVPPKSVVVTMLE